jgi:acyl carrier protein
LLADLFVGSSAHPGLAQYVSSTSISILSQHGCLEAMMNATFRKLREILIDLGVDAREIGPKASFVSLGLDSLEMQQLVLELEDAFKIEIPGDDLPQLITVQNAIDYADKRVTIS